MRNFIAAALALASAPAAAACPAANGCVSPTITVLAAFTPNAIRELAAAGQTPAQRVALDITWTNNAYRNSGRVASLRLVTTIPLAQNDTGNPLSDLSRLRNKGDGWFEEVHLQRNNWRADIVVGYFGDIPGATGAGYTPGGTTTTGESWGFAIVNANRRYTGAERSSSFAHETGHVQGAGHNVENDATNKLPYAHGVTLTSLRLRTVMAYNRCTPECPRFPFFSAGGRITYRGVKVGDATHDNVRAMNFWAGPVSRYR